MGRLQPVPVLRDTCSIRDHLLRPAEVQVPGMSATFQLIRGDDPPLEEYPIIYISADIQITSIDANRCFSPCHAMLTARLRHPRAGAVVHCLCGGTAHGGCSDQLGFAWGISTRESGFVGLLIKLAAQILNPDATLDPQPP